MTELRQIPNVGAQTEQDLISMGYTTIASLRGKRAEELYAEECRLRGCLIDRCQLTCRNGKPENAPVATSIAPSPGSTVSFSTPASGRNTDAPKRAVCGPITNSFTVGQ